MLKKLLKYDLKDIYKELIIFYILSIIFAIITRILFNIENSAIFNILAQISSGITISMIFNILINNIMRIWGRFKKNIYNDEAYLTHTLPVTKENIYLAKFLTIIITMFTSIIIIILTIFIAYYSKENIELLKSFLVSLVSFYDTNITIFLLVIFTVLFFQFTSMIQSGITGLIIGHSYNKNKIVYSLMYGICIYFFLQIISLLILFIFGIFNENIMNLFMTNNIESQQLLIYIMYFAIILYLIYIIILYILNTYLLKKGVNID